MAIGTITILDELQLNDDGETLYKVSFAGDTAQPAGGVLEADVMTKLTAAVLTAAGVATDANVRGVRTMQIRDIIPGDCGQYMPTWSGAKMKVLDGGSGTRAEATGNLSGTTFKLSFVCA